MNASSAKSKYIALISYAKADDVERILNEKSELLNYAFWILHDKDNATPHIHLVVGLTTSRKIDEVANWFKKCTNDEGVVQNTIGEPVIDCSSIVDYLTHSDVKSKQAGKHQYTVEDIKVSRGSIDDFAKEKTDKQRREEAEAKLVAKADECEQLLNDIIDNVSCREMARRYGRDFIKNHKAYREYAAMVVLEEDGDIDKASKIAGNGFEFWKQEAQREAFEDGVVTALNRVYDIVTNEENGYSKTTRNDLKKVYREFSVRKDRHG